MGANKTSVCVYRVLYFTLSILATLNFAPHYDIIR